MKYIHTCVCCASACTKEPTHVYTTANTHMYTCTYMRIYKKLMYAHACIHLHTHTPPSHLCIHLKFLLDQVGVGDPGSDPAALGPPHWCVHRSAALPHTLTLAVAKPEEPSWGWRHPTFHLPRPRGQTLRATVGTTAPVPAALSWKLALIAPALGLTDDCVRGLGITPAPHHGVGAGRGRVWLRPSCQGTPAGRRPLLPQPPQFSCRV